jgi:CubicO group peptidase (beta-lactamase class C family)
MVARALDFKSIGRTLMRVPSSKFQVRATYRGGMRFLPVVALLLIVCACDGIPGSTTSLASTTTALPETTTTVEPLVECPQIPYQVPGLPDSVAGESADLSAIEEDEFTALGGTRSVFWVDGDGNLTVALIRGALPPREWPGERGEIEIAGQRAVVGPFEDGLWVAGWFDNDGQDRCDLYTMVFYPPIEPHEVETALASITRSP